MHRWRSLFLKTVVTVLLYPLTSSIHADIVLRDAKVFTGEEILETATVVFQGSRIVAISTDTVLPPEFSEYKTIDAKGMTLLPGLIDAHTHNYGDSLELSLNFGVTTVIDMFSDPGLARTWRREQVEGPVWDRSDFFGAGVLVTVAGGHGTQFGIPIPTLDDIANVDSFIEQRIEEGSDFVKIVYEHGFDENYPLPTHKPSSLTRIVKATHAFDKLAVFHISTAAEALAVIEAGADALVHVYSGNSEEESVELVNQAVDKEIFVIPTLSVIESVFGNDGGMQLAEDARISPYLDERQRNSLRSNFGRPHDAVGLDRALRNVSQLHQASVPILAGSDAPNPGTTWGASLHWEIELLVAAGLSNREALFASTVAPAEYFGLSDRGRIREGYRADAVLVRGDPLSDITATRDIHSIFKNGREVERSVNTEKSVSSNQSSEDTLQIAGKFDVHSLEDLVSVGWVASADEDFGGESLIELKIVQRGQGNALNIQGEIKKGYAYPWSGAMIYLGKTPMQPVDVSGYSELVFWARGQSKHYRVLAFAESLGFIPATVEFQATEEWKKIEIPFDKFRGLRADGAMAFLFSGPSQLGEFWLEIDDVSIEE